MNIKSTGGAPTRGQARVDAILTAASELVAEVGYERVTVDAIAARAHASKATMYNRWATKAALIADALRRQAEGPGTLDIADTGSLREDLLIQVGSIAASLTGDDGPSLLNLLEAVRDNADLRELVRTQIEGASAHVGEVLDRQARSRGEAAGPVDAQEALGVAVAQLLTTTLLTGSSPSVHYQRRLVDDILMPLLTRSPE